MKIFYRKDMYFRISMLIMFVCCFGQDVNAQAGIDFKVEGKVLDSATQQPLSYATIQVLSAPSAKIVSDHISDEQGNFSVSLKNGRYYLLITFMGYQSHRTRSFSLTDNLNLGDVRLSSASANLEEVIVQAEKSSMQLTLDKKIFNVGQDLGNAGGSALDILSNVPSLSVDPEGRVKLRGSDNVRILIDGKPSGLVSFKGGGGLQQLQANMIERVEIITNPSARYEAEGMAGIINIVLKKERKQGFNGSIELTSGYPANFGAAANLNYRHKRVNFFINYSLAYRKTPAKGNLYQEVYSDDTVLILEQENTAYISGLANNIRGGIDYFFSEKSVLTGSYLYRRSDADRLTEYTYKDYLFNTSNLQSLSTRRQDETEHEPNSEYSLIYKRSFKEKDHELVAEFKFLDNWESSKQLYTQQFYSPQGAHLSGKDIVQHSPNDEWEKQYLLQVDYIKPIGSDGKFETGFRSSIRKMTNDYLVTERDSTGQDIPLPRFDNVFFYDENIHAVYGIIANKKNRFSYQAGVRAEWTDVTTRLETTNERNPRKYMNLFPSAHVSFEMGNDNALQLSYSRRVRRPFYNDLTPYYTFSDSRNFASGNPDLNPEFSDVVEVGHIKTFDKGTFSSAVYYRNTQGKIQSIRTVDNEGNSTTKPMNLSSETSFGAEFISNYSPFNWWKLDFNVNFFYSDIDGSNIIKDYTATTTSWYARQTSRFTLANHFDLQLRLNYEAPRNTVQGRQLSLFYTDFSASKDVFKGKGTIFFNVLDVFNSRWSRSINRGDNFYSRGEFLGRKRQVNLTFSYRIRQAKAVKTKEEE
jgi:ferric enterobactin receptor